MPTAQRTYRQALRDYLHAICLAIGVIGIAAGGVMFQMAHGRTERWIEAAVVLALGAAFLFGAFVLKGPAETLRKIRELSRWARKDDRNGDSKRDT